MKAHWMAVILLVSSVGFADVKTYYPADEVLNFAVEKAKTYLIQDAKVELTGATIAREGSELDSVFTGSLTYAVNGEPCGLTYKISVATKTIVPTLPPKIPGLPEGGLTLPPPRKVSYLKVDNMGPLNCAP